MAVKVREWRGAFWLFIDHHGRRKARRVGVGKTGKKSAELAAIRIQARLAEGGDLSVLEPPAIIPSLKVYAERWLDGVAALRCQPSTVELYRHRLTTRLLPALGSLPLTAITRERIKTLVAEQFRAGSLRTEGRSISPKTLRAVMSTLITVLNSAVEDGLIPSNPAARWGHVVRADQAEVEEVGVFTPEELTRLLEVTERDYSDAYPFILCLARTGLRLGEAMALQWADVDFAQRILLVRRSARRGRTTIPKNGKARRVDMSLQLSDVLRGCKTLGDAEAAVEGREASPWVFPALAADPGAQDAFRRRWRRILDQAELRYRKPHTLRHTYASLLIQGGEPITYVQQQLGHHSAAFTLAVYTHFVPRGDRRAVDALDDTTGRNLYATTSYHAAATST
jgi:integrase